MARLDFSRLSVLLVEDSQFMRSLFIGVLRALGVEKVTTAEDGAEAIQIMSPVGGSSGPMVGKTGIDLVISDYFMPSVDGLLLLRWIRRGGKSPDRFLPFVMVSAAADREIIVESRDAGCDEFLAKPFSAEMMAKRLVSAIEFPRPFVYCPTYFGPDRRRQKKILKDERRVIKKEEIETVYSGKDLANLQKSGKKVWHFKMPKALQQKLATGFGGADDNEPAFDPKLLEAAEAKVKDMEADYADWVGETVEELTQAHHRAIEEVDEALTHLETIHKIAHELRGQGGIFGYPLMTQFGKSLYECTKEGTNITAPLLDLINAHIDLIKTVIHQKIKGDGGDVGKELMKVLAEAKAKHGANEDTKS